MDKCSLSSVEKNWIFQRLVELCTALSLKLGIIYTEKVLECEAFEDLLGLRVLDIDAALRKGNSIDFGGCIISCCPILSAVGYF